MKPPFDVKAEMKLSRTFDAPRDLVFEAWTKPEHMRAWWGPTDFTLPICEVDLRAGGAFAFVMEGPDGKRYPFLGTYEEVSPPERLVFLGTIEHEPSLQAFTTVTFVEHAGKTLVTVHQVFSRGSDSARGASQGWGQSLDRLGDLLGKLHT